MNLCVNGAWSREEVSSVGDKEWYFFCKRGRKYRNSIRPNRVTGSGFWKATGIDKPIYSAKEPHHHHQQQQPQQHCTCIGLKKSLVYYRGCAGKGTKTDWMMHEFRLPPDGTHHFSNAKDLAQEAEVWTLCRIFKRTQSNNKYAATTAAWKSDATIKQNGAGSKSCDLEADGSHNSTDQQCASFCDSVVQQNDSKPNVFMDQVDARNCFLLGGTAPWSSTSTFIAQQAPFSVTNYPSFFNHPNGDVDVFTNGNWDELRSVVEVALEPYRAYPRHAFDCT